MPIPARDNLTPSRTVGSFGRPIRGEWLLDEDIVFLNHGSFGATPRRVLEAQSALRAWMERQPVAFLDGELPGLLRAAASELASFVGACGEDLVFIDNATTGVNAVVGSFQFEPGDEIATTTHMYGAVRKTLRHLARRTGVRVVEAPVPFPLPGPDEVVDAFVGALGPRTRLASVDHVTSPSALVMPVERLVAACRERGVPVLIDGAHAPGMLPLDVPAIGADFYVGNCHKWLFAPKGCGFLWAHRDRQGDLHPTVISHGLGG